MKNKFFILSLLLACPAAYAADDCSKNLDACSAGTTKQSPFIAASLRESVPPHVERMVKKTTAPFLAPSTAAASEAAGASPAEAGGRLSSPAWLLLVFTGVAGLYFYLRGGNKKRRRK